MSELEPEHAVPRLLGSLGRPYLYAAETSSTQDILRGADATHGAVAVAEHQTGGRGRLGRTWDDAPSKALLCSVLLRPPATAPLPQLSLVAGLATAAAIERGTGLQALVKWPNDVLVDGAKVAGILLEAAGGAVVCGIGVNVNQDEGELPTDTRLPATSLRAATGQPFDRGILLASILAGLERRYDAWLDGGLERLAVELEQRNALSGRRVSIGSRTGTAAAIEADGRLAVELDEGGTMLVESGEVELGAPLSPR